MRRLLEGNDTQEVLSDALHALPLQGKGPRPVLVCFGDVVLTATWTGHDPEETYHVTFPEGTRLQNSAEVLVHILIEAHDKLD